MIAVTAHSEPNQIFVKTDTEWKALERISEGEWGTAGISVSLEKAGDAASLILESPQEPIQLIKLRWSSPPSGSLRILGDHWERAYGDLEWRGLVAERAMPWYFLVHNGERTDGFGVMTGAQSFCYWQLDTGGLTLTADVTSGNAGVRLGARRLLAATIKTMRGNDNESPFEAAKRFCSLMCERPVLPKQPVYGGNNWYYAYGISSHEAMLEDSRFISSLSSNAANRPYMVIDDGWQISSGKGSCNGGPWVSNAKFPHMDRLAGAMKEIGVKPGLWCRPLLTAEAAQAGWIRYSTGDGHVLDPSIPDVLEYIRKDVARMTSEWGFELLKHDFTTYDLLGQWGFTMKSKPHALPHAFSDRSRTTAEITLDLYRTIAEASGQADVIGCNTFSHLSAGLFEIQRTGDDTSGRWWERTRYMGVNTMAFRMPQHNTFYSHDADCLGLTKDVPWELNKQWLHLLAGSGTPLFVSVAPHSATREQQQELSRAFELAAVEQPAAEPLDWLDTTCPSRWLMNGKEVRYDWNRLSADLLQEKDNGWWL